MNNELKLDESWIVFSKTYLTGNSILIGIETFQQQAIKELEEEMDRNSTSISPKVVTSCYYGLELALKIIKNLKAPENGY